MGSPTRLLGAEKPENEFLDLDGKCNQALQVPSIWSSNNSVLRTSQVTHPAWLCEKNKHRPRKTLGRVAVACDLWRREKKAEPGPSGTGTLGSLCLNFGEMEGRKGGDEGLGLGWDVGMGMAGAV